MKDPMTFMREVGRNEWTQRDGVVKTFAAMDCGHLHNVLKMLGRRKQRVLVEADAASCYSGGDMAQMYAEHAADAASTKAAAIAFDMRLLLAYIKTREEHNFIVEGPK